MSLLLARLPVRPVSAPTVAVVITCHASYLPWLPAALDSVNRQSVDPVQKILVLDGCGPPILPCLSGWQVIHGDWNEPNPARNAALDCVMADWVAYLDADNLMPAGYLEGMLAVAAKAENGVAFCYPNVMRADANLQAQAFVEVPEYDYWKFRRESFADTSSLWRVRALKSIRWLEGIPCRDDHALVLRLTAKGWRGKKAHGQCVLLRGHGENRCGSGRFRETLWKARSLAVVTLCSGSHYFFQVHDWMMKQKWPEDTTFHWVDDSASIQSAVGGEFSTALRLCADALRAKGVSVHITTAPPSYWEQDSFWGKHGCVADLYNAVLPGLRADIVITLEDDVAPIWGGAKLLCESLTGMNNLAAIGGTYEARGAPGRICCSMHPKVWRDLPKWRDVPHQPFKVGMVAGGFTAWAGWALHRLLPFTITQDIKLGWDGTACVKARAMGYEFMLDGRAECCHLCVPD